MKRRQEKAAGATTLQAIFLGAAVEVQLGLDVARQASDAKFLIVREAAVPLSVGAWSYHFRPDAPELRVMVATVLLVFF